MSAPRSATPSQAPSFSAPIGVFDSGIGGLSVLQALRHELPHERFVYLADSGNAPYGERGDDFVIARTRTIAQHLIQAHGIKALVIACNTATTAAVSLLRAELPGLPLIGVEPALKPASLSSQTHHVGVIATRGTVSSQRFARLVAEHGAHTQFHVQACDGLARAIEQSTEVPLPADPSATETRALCALYTGMLGSFGVKTGQMDTLVLGCTHYIFAKDDLRALLGPEVQLIDTGAPVARQTRRLLAAAGHLAPEPAGAPANALAGPAQLQLMTTGSLAALQSGAQRWLQLPATCCQAADMEQPATARG
ncbi:MAG: glutamate racemase [Acidovorax sp.]|nr:glutamate racemase [Acidovorax sp.]